jgi:UDP-2,3-diacylglucosamine pyrophosphatase LpxH
MLVIISDLHLTDGTTGITIGAGAFEDFRARLQDLAFDASYRADGRYEPIQTLDLLLLGDIFDIIRSTKWTEQKEGQAGYVRPWHDPQSALFINKIRDITRAILAQNAEAFAILKGVSSDHPVTIPDAHDGRKRVPVHTNIHYLVGNHDWFFHLPGAEYDALRQEVNQALGLSNPPGPYPHDPAQTPWLLDIYKAHSVFARHGDIYDPFNYDKQKGRNAATLGDAFVVELINLFPQEVKARMGDELPAPLLAGLNELANVRPSLLVPVWIDTLLKNMKIPAPQAKRVKAIWDELANAFLQLDFVRDKDTIRPFDAVDVLEIVLKLYDNVSLDTAAKAIRFIEDKLWGGHSSFAHHALDETAFKERWARHIIYGHTHHYEIVPLDKVYVGYDSFDQLYYNSGTWHAVHELARAHDDRFVFFQVMSFLAFFKPDERKGRPFETWAGALGARGARP